MKDKAFFDTNVLLYAFEKNNARSTVAANLLFEGGVVGVQSLNEFAAAAVRKFKRPWEVVLQALQGIRLLCPNPVAVTIETHDKGLEIVARYGYRIYDALLISAALEASCTIFYSEDLHDGQVIEGLTIRNPFTTVH